VSGDGTGEKCFRNGVAGPGRIYWLPSAPARSRRVTRGWDHRWLLRARVRGICETGWWDRALWAEIRVNCPDACIYGCGPRCEALDWGPTLNGHGLVPRAVMGRVWSGRAVFSESVSLWKYRHCN
jgi:hypothetical protein